MPAWMFRLRAKRVWRKESESSGSRQPNKQTRTGGQQHYGAASQEEANKSLQFTGQTLC